MSKSTRLTGPASDRQLARKPPEAFTTDPMPKPRIRVSQTPKHEQITPGPRVRITNPRALR